MKNLINEIITVSFVKHTIKQAVHLDKVSRWIFLIRMQLDYVDVGMIQYVDDHKNFDNIFNGEIIKYEKLSIWSGYY